MNFTPLFHLSIICPTSQKIKMPGELAPGLCLHSETEPIKAPFLRNS